MLKNKKIIIFAAAFLMWFSIYSYQSNFTPYMESLKFTPTMIGLIIGSYGFTQMVLRVPLGVLSDKLGTRKLFIILGIISTFVSALLLFLSENMWVVLFARASAGIAASTWVSFVVLFSSYHEKDKSVKAMIDEVMMHCSVLLPGVSELLMISGKNTLEEAIEKCFENQTLEVITLKKGSEGCEIYTRDEVVKFGVYEVETIDPTGAGDCFDGAFICGLLEGKSITDCAKTASAAAALNTAVLGPMEGKISKEAINKIVS